MSYYSNHEDVEKIQEHLKKEGLPNTYSRDTFLLHLHNRMRSNKCLNYQDYLLLLKENRNEVSLFKKDLSINITSFFRDPEVFELFRVMIGIYIKEIINRGKISRIRIWSAGCANGSEPYSISIILHQVLQHKLSDYNVKIFATDISESILSIARTGKYPSSMVNDLPENNSRQFFTETSNSHCRLKSSIRKIVQFDYLDLLTDSPPFKDLDVIFCRYVLMYFQSSQRNVLIRKYYDLLKAGGFLILGRTDPIPLSLQELYNPISIKKGIYQKPLSEIQQKLILDNLPVEEYFCEWCGRPFNRIKSLRLHIEHSPCKLGQFQCYVCKKELFSKTGLFGHLKYTHYIDRSNKISRVFNEIPQY
ncbi:MAG: CheR family methyltransferase [Promethearchaeota archaeon]